jgi:hypothetical protein
MKNLMFIVKFALVLFIMGWIAKTWAVPAEVKAEVTAHPVVFQGGCAWRNIEAPCQIFYNQPAEVIYLVIYTADLKEITHVVKVTEDKQETVLYVNPKYTT